MLRRLAVALVATAAIAVPIAAGPALVEAPAAVAQAKPSQMDPDNRYAGPTGKGKQVVKRCAWWQVFGC